MATPKPIQLPPRYLDNKEFTIIKRFSFDSAHCLEGDQGKCGKQHGHTWSGEVHCQGTSSQLNDGILVDFREISAIVSELDHENLNDRMGLTRPTAEVIAAYLLARVPCAVKVILNETIGNQVIVTHKFASAGTSRS